MIQKFSANKNVTEEEKYYSKAADVENAQKEWNSYMEGYLSYRLFYGKFKEYYNLYIDTHKSRILREQYSSFYDFFENKYTESYRDKHNAEFIDSQILKYKDFFKEVYKGNDLNRDQKEAIFADEDAILVNAGAGTGKTKVIESKFLHLHTHKNVPLHKILVMVFGKAARQELVERVDATLKNSKVLHEGNTVESSISTFHAMGLKILKDSLYNKSDSNGINEVSHNINVLDDRSKAVKSAIKKICNDSTITNLITNYILYFAKHEPEVTEFGSLDEYYKYIKNNKVYYSLLKKKRQDGDNETVICKSWGEVLIANFLWMYNIEGEYEPTYLNITEGNKNIPYRPDFYIPSKKIFIEYWGVDSDGNTRVGIDRDKYVYYMQKKRKAHMDSGTNLIELSYADLQQGTSYFVNKLAKAIKSYGISLGNKKPIDEVIEIWTMTGELTQFESLLSTFLALYKESYKDLQQIIDAHKANERTNSFLTIFKAFYQAYTKILQEDGMIDFGDMIKEAVNVLPHTVGYHYDYVLVDEFQDISPARAKLLQAILKKNPDMKILAVGDDWQSIYKFAGSDTSIFKDFEEWFGFTKKITLGTTYRFNLGISQFSGIFVMKNPTQTRKMLSTIRGNLHNTIELVGKYQYDDGYDYSFFQYILDEIRKNKNPGDKKEIMILSRYTRQKYKEYYLWDLIIQQKFGKGELIESGEKQYKKWKTIDNIYIQEPLTLHKAKGLEADIAIVDSVNTGYYDFPSTMTDDPVLQLLSSTPEMYLYAEERRLFYVGITRGKEKTYILYDKNEGKESPFVVESKELLLSSGIGQESGYDGGVYDRITDGLECKMCAGKMKIKTNSKQGTYFWGCENYPLCTHTINYVAEEHDEMREKIESHANISRENYIPQITDIDLKNAIAQDIHKKQLSLDDLGFYKVQSNSVSDNQEQGMIVDSKDDLIGEIEDSEVYNDRGFNVDGIHRNGTRYNRYNKRGFDIYGYNRRGFDSHGLHRNGTLYDEDGYDIERYDYEGYDVDGYNRRGFDSHGLHRNGTLYDEDGYDRNGYNREGCDVDGYNIRGFAAHGLHRNGTLYDEDGYDIERYDYEGYDVDGYDVDGYNRRGFDSHGLHRNGTRYNEYGLDFEGYDKNGYDKDGYNKDGYDKVGYNKNGYNKRGYDRNNRSIADYLNQPTTFNKFDTIREENKALNELYGDGID